MFWIYWEPGDLWWEFLCEFLVNFLLPKTTSFVDPNRIKKSQEIHPEIPPEIPTFPRDSDNFLKYSLKIPSRNLLLVDADDMYRLVWMSRGNGPSAPPTHPIPSPSPISISLSRSTDLIIRINDLNMILNGHLNPQDELCNNGCSKTMPTKRCGIHCKLHLPHDDRRSSSPFR